MTAAGPHRQATAPRDRRPDGVESMSASIDRVGHHGGTSMSTRATVHRAVAAVLALALLPLSGCGLFRDPRAEAHERVTGVRQAVHAAGSVTVDFDVEIGPRDYRRKAYWEGTTQLQYGDRPASQTEFSLAAVEQPSRGQPGGSHHFQIQKIISEGLPRAESVRYYLSEDWDTPEGRPWVRIEPGVMLEYGSSLGDPDDVEAGEPWAMVETPDVGIGFWRTYVNPDLGLLDPEWYLALFASIGWIAIDDPDRARQEEIDGVTTDVYSIECLFGDWDVFDGAQCPFPTDDDPLLTLFPGDKQFNIDVWLTDDNRPRRLVATFTFLTSDGFYTATAEMTFRDYGAPVDITPPPADQVTGWPPVP